MSFIQSTIKCKHCGYEMNIAEGTFGYGVPTQCPHCNEKGEQYTDGWYTVMSSGWHAKNNL